MAKSDWREPLGALVLQRAAAAQPPDRPHALDRVRGLIECVAASGAEPARYDVGLSPSELEEGAKELELHLPIRPFQVDGPGPPRAVMLHLSSPEDVRGWPEGSWDRLLIALEERNRAVLVLSGPGSQQAPATASDSGCIVHGELTECALRKPWEHQRWDAIGGAGSMIVPGILERGLAKKPGIHIRKIGARLQKKIVNGKATLFLEDRHGGVGRQQG